MYSSEQLWKKHVLLLGNALQNVCVHVSLLAILCVPNDGCQQNYVHSIVLVF